MAFFEDIGKRISQTSQDVMKKTKNFADTTKLSAMISEEERNIDSLCLRIGKLYCEICKGNPDPQLCELVTEVMKSKKKVGEFRERIAQINEMQKSQLYSAVGLASEQPASNAQTDKATCCTVCGSEITGEQRFCTNCGTEIQQVIAQKCPQCGKQLPPDAMFCSDCGSTIE